MQAPESRNRRHAGDHVRNNLLPSIGATVFCIILAPVYYRFSHGVHSPWMTFLFLWPLVLGVLPALLLMRMSARALPGTAARILYGTGVEALTFGSLLRGILEIAGTSSMHEEILMPAGWCLVLGGIVLYLITIVSDRNFARSSANGFKEKCLKAMHRLSNTGLQRRQ